MLLQSSKPAISREAYYQTLQERCVADSNSELICRMIASWHYGDGMLPSYLGLDQASYLALWQHYFPMLHPWSCEGRDIDRSRQYEREDLTKLLTEHADLTIPSSLWLVEIIVAANMGMDHLWQDLGLWSRSELSQLMQINFPDLAAKNSQGMKWKKFIYKQLCDLKGVYVCRAPSCDVCDDYDVCFGTED